MDVNSILQCPDTGTGRHEGGSLLDHIRGVRSHDMAAEYPFPIRRGDNLAYPFRLAKAHGLAISPE